MKLIEILNQELFDLSEAILDETYDTISDIKKLANDLIKQTAEFNYEEIERTGKFQYLYGVPLNSVDGTKYPSLGNFVQDMKIHIFYVTNNNNGNKGEYSYYRTLEKNKFNPKIEREINVYYDFESFKSEVNTYIREGKLNLGMFYSLIFRMYSTLVHELQHAFDDYRSGGQIYNSKEFKDYRNDNRSIMDDLNKVKKYLNLPHEIWARFSQTMLKLRFYDVDFTDDGVVYRMYPLNGVVKSFPYYFEGFAHLSQNMKRKLISKVAQFWHLEKDKIEKSNGKQS